MDSSRLRQGFGVASASALNDIQKKEIKSAEKITPHCKNLQKIKLSIDRWSYGFFDTKIHFSISNPNLCSIKIDPEKSKFLHDKKEVSIKKKRFESLVIKPQETITGYFKIKKGVIREQGQYTVSINYTDEFMAFAPEALMLINSRLPRVAGQPSQ